MGLTLTVTNAGRAALVNAANTGTAPVTIAEVGLTGTAVTPDATATALPGEFKRLATLSGDVVADDTIHLIVRDETGDVFTVRGLALYLADGTLFAIYGQADVLVEKSAQALMLLAIDVQFADVDAAQLTFGDANFLNPPATTAQMGVVELATLAETIAGIDAARVPAAKMVKDAVISWLDARFGADNSGIWHPANDGAGSGLDADLLDGQQGSWYSNIPARLGYTPVQQGTGNGQGANTVKIGWSGSRLKATVDVTDQGNFVFDGHISDVWRSSNDGAGSGLDADLLDGQHGSYYTAAGNLTGTVTVPVNAALRHAKGGGYFHLGSFSVGTYGDGECRIWWNENLKRLVLHDALDLSIGGGIAWHTGNDGVGSGLDADLLDGMDASDFAQYGAAPTKGITDANVVDASGWYTLSAATGAPYGTSVLLHIERAYGAGQTAMQLNVDSNGDLYFRSGTGASGAGRSWVTWGRVFTTVNDGAGSGLDADMVDGIQGASIARKDINETFGALLTIARNSNEQLRLGYDVGATRDPYLGLYDGLTTRRGYLQALANQVRLYRDGGAYLDLFDSGDARINGNQIMHLGNDGAGSGFDADLLDGQQGSYYLAASSYTAADVKAKLLTVDGSGSGLDADTVDGIQGASLVTLTGTQVLTNKTLQSPTIDSADMPTISGTAPLYLARAWVDFDVSSGTPTIMGSGNVSSITDLGVGQYTVNFTTALPNANYSIGSAMTNSSVQEGCVNIYSRSAKTTTSCRVRTTTGGNTLIDADIVNMTFTG